jgi:hypothetical protein
MLKLKKIDFLIKNNKIQINQNTDVVTTKVKEGWLLLATRGWGSFFSCGGGGRRRKNRGGERRVDNMVIY